MPARYLFRNIRLRHRRALTVNNMHNLEHYGNLATYMRLKNIVPPTSGPPPQAQTPPKK